jgi:hypothetical protein
VIMALMRHCAHVSRALRQANTRLSPRLTRLFHSLPRIKYNLCLPVAICVFSHHQHLNMPSPIATILAPPQGYAYTFLPNIDPKETCFVCHEPYNTPEGCLAIKLTHCGHVVGLACLEEWARRRPNTCLHWNHHIPSLNKPHDRGRYETVLAWICGTSWFRTVDKLVQECPRIGYNHRDHQPGILVSWFCTVCCATSIGAFTVCVCALVPMSLGGFCIAVACPENIFWNGMFGVAMIVLDVCVWTVFCNAMVYMTIANCVFGLAGRKERKLRERGGRYRVG